MICYKVSLAIPHGAGVVLMVPDGAPPKGSNVCGCGPEGDKRETQPQHSATVARECRTVGIVAMCWKELNGYLGLSLVLRTYSSYSSTIMCAFNDGLQNQTRLAGTGADLSLAD